MLQLAFVINLFNHAKNLQNSLFFFALWHMHTTHPYVIMPYLKRDHRMKYFNNQTTKQYYEILPRWPNIQLCSTAFILKLLLSFNSEIAKMEFSVFWIGGDLRRFSWKSIFFEEIIGDLRKNFKFEEIWGGVATLIIHSRV